MAVAGSGRGSAQAGRSDGPGSGVVRRAPPRRRPRAPARQSAPPSTWAPGSPTNRSPGVTARESMTARPLEGGARGGRRRDQPRPSRLGDSLRGPGPHAQRLARDGHVVEGRCARPRTPGPARGPCRRSPRRPPAAQRHRAPDGLAAVDVRLGILTGHAGEDPRMIASGSSSAGCRR